MFEFETESKSKTWKHILIVFGVAMAMIFIVSWLASESVRHDAEQCEAKNGIMIRGVQGFHCLDNKSIIK